MQSIRFHFALIIVCALINTVNAEFYTYANQSVKEISVVRRIHGVSVTSCFGKCKQHGKCHGIAFNKQPKLGQLNECFLLNKDVGLIADGILNEESKKNQKQIKSKSMFLFVVKEVSNMYDFLCFNISFIYI